MDYLIGKLRDQTEVQIRTRIRPNSKTYHINTSLLFTIGRKSVISDAIDEWCCTSGVYLCQRTIFWTFNADVYVFEIRRKSSDFFYFSL